MEINISELNNQDNYISFPENKQVSEFISNRNYKNQSKNPPISYEEIMAKMGMFVANGQLHLLDEKPSNIKKSLEDQIIHGKKVQETYKDNIPPNSYIYNKYFQNYGKQDSQVKPMNALEYRNKLINDIIQKKKISIMKSRKLMMPTSNISFNNGNVGDLNKLFSFSKR